MGIEQRIEGLFDVGPPPSGLDVRDRFARYAKPSTEKLARVAVMSSKELFDESNGRLREDCASVP